MNTEILNIDAITIIEEMPEAPAILLANEAEGIQAEAAPHLTTSFGSVDLWKIRNKRRHFIFYR